METLFFPDRAERRIYIDLWNTSARLVRNGKSFRRSSLFHTHMLRLKRECLFTRNSLWIRSTIPCRRNPFQQSFIQRYNSTIASQRSSNPKDDLPATWSFWFVGALCLGAIGLAEWRRSEPFRHTVHAAIRCSRVAREMILLVLLSARQSSYHRCCNSRCRGL